MGHLYSVFCRYRTLSAFITPTHEVGSVVVIPSFQDWKFFGTQRWKVACLWAESADIWQKLSTHRSYDVPGAVLSNVNPTLSLIIPVTIQVYTSCKKWLPAPLLHPYGVHWVIPKWEMRLWIFNQKPHLLFAKIPYSNPDTNRTGGFWEAKR